MSKRIRLSGLTPELTDKVLLLLPDLNLEASDTADTRVCFTPADALRLEEKDGEILLCYSNLHELFRGLSYLPDFLESRQSVSEKQRSSMLCYMADMSRNAVYNLPTAKQMIRYLSLMGYDSLMLYTEDTFELPGYPYFGHMRGRFSAEELKELDDYAYGFGIELIPCVQTLAHLSTAIRWPDFGGWCDIDDILLVGDERTYQFIDAVLEQSAKCFRSRRINIGMDEAHHVGCGKYLQKNGYRKPSDIMCDHLERVVELCYKHGLSPMIWSDMFFRMAFNGAYYVTSGEIPPEVIAKVPKGLTLIYWDYYSRDRQTVSHMLDCHKKFPNPTVFAGGAWKWYGFGAHNHFSLESTELQLNVCEEYGIDNIIVTAWGDNGGEASQFSVLATMIYFAERSYRASGEISKEHLERRARALFHIGFEDLLAFDLPDYIPGCKPEETVRPKNPSKYLLYNDPLEGFFDQHFDPATAPAAFAENAERLMTLASHPTFGYAYETLGKLCKILAHKCDLGIRLRHVYTEKDTAKLSAMAEEADMLIAELRDFTDTFRRQWYRENKTFGFSAEEQRLGGLCERLRSVSLRIHAYLNGEISAIEELEQPNLPYSRLAEGSSPYISANNWKASVAAGLL